MKPIRMSIGKVLNEIRNHELNIAKCKENAEEVGVSSIEIQYWNTRKRIQEDLLDQKHKLLKKIEGA